MLGKIISPEQSITKANDFLNLWLKMWTNYCVVAADNLLEGRMGVAKQNSIQTSINDKHKSEQRMWDEEGINLSRVNAEYDYSRQSTLNTMIEQKCDDQIRMRGRRFCSCLKDVMGVANKKWRLRSSQRLPTDLSQSNSMLQNSIQTSINDTNTTSEQPMWDEEGMSLSRVNVEYNYSRQSTLKLWLNKSVMTKSGCVEEDFVMHKINNIISILQKQPEYRSA